MMYKNLFVGAIKLDGKVLREEKDFVTLPFGSEYIIYLKNLNTVRAKAKVFIDSEDVTFGGVILNPGSSLDLERYIKNHNLDAGNRFRFIERTQDIENHRGIEAEDGLIRIEYAFEKKAPVVQETHTHHYDHYHQWPYYWPYRYNRRWNDGCWNLGYTSNLGGLQGYAGNTGFTTTSGAVGQAGTWVSGSNAQMSGNVSFTGNLMKCENSSSASLESSVTANDVGITVPGSMSNQKFVAVSDFSTEVGDAIIIRLRGFVEEKKVTKAVTVEDKKTCPSCGKKSEYKSQFCASCGTALVVV